MADAGEPLRDKLVWRGPGRARPKVVDFCFRLDKLPRPDTTGPNQQISAYPTQYVDDEPHGAANQRQPLGKALGEPMMMDVHRGAHIVGRQ